MIHVVSHIVPVDVQHQFLEMVAHLEHHQMVNVDAVVVHHVCLGVSAARSMDLVTVIHVVVVYGISSMITLAKATLTAEQNGIRWHNV